MINFLFDRTPLYFMTQSFWRDEGFSYFMAKQRVGDMIQIMARDFNPPLYYLILHFWMKIFGSSEVLLRSLSLIFFAMNIYAVFLFLQNILKIKGNRIWIYLIMFSLNPFVLYYGFEVRMYSLFALLATLSIYSFLRKQKTRYLTFTVLGLYTHYFFIFVILTQIVYRLLFERGTIFKKIKILIIPLIIYLPWFLYVMPTLMTKTTSFWMKRLGIADFFSALGILFTGYERFYKFYDFLIILVSFFFVLVLTVFILTKKKSRLFYLLVLWSFLAFFLVFFISFFKPIFVPRYLIFAPVGFCLLLSYIAEHSEKKIRFFLISLIFLITFSYTAFDVAVKRKGNVRKTIREIKKLATKDDYLFVSDKNCSSYFVAVYYFDESRVYLYKEKSEDIPYFIGRALLPENKIITKLPHYPRKAFVLDNDYQYRILSAL